ncbi:unnamed protein product [Urochloa humidicola]
MESWLTCGQGFNNTTARSPAGLGVLCIFGFSFIDVVLQAIVIRVWVPPVCVGSPPPSAMVASCPDSAESISYLLPYKITYLNWQDCSNLPPLAIWSYLEKNERWRKDQAICKVTRGNNTSGVKNSDRMTSVSE